MINVHFYIKKLMGFVGKVGVRSELNGDEISGVIIYLGAFVVFWWWWW